ncbi:hypothetical protein BDF22DRAFT_774183 [Syncephalis plumigaleata]|nr:hypothetical protein BDF22DRAFT_774183 [Syncephalis plumigaleata]
MESSGALALLTGPLKLVYSVVNKFRRPFMVVAKATDEFLKAPVTVKLDNKSDLVLLDVCYHTVVGSCTYPGRHPVLRPDTSDKLMFASPDSYRYYAIVGWRANRFQSKARVVTHINRTESKYSLCTTPDLIKEQCSDERCELSSLCDTRAQSIFTASTGKYYAVNVAIGDVLPATVKVEISEEEHTMHFRSPYYTTCRGFTRYGEMNPKLCKPYNKRLKK